VSKPKPNGFIKVERHLWSSDLWRALSANAQVVLLDIMYRRTARNNGRIVYGLRDAMARTRCSKATAKRVLGELRGAGLIEPTVRASFDNKSGASKGQATQWRLTFVK
jgi:hypothetical protein